MSAQDPDDVVANVDRVVKQVGISHDDPVTLQIDPARTALVLLDYQNYNVHPDGYWAQAIPGSAERAAPAVARTAQFLAAARTTGITVIHVQNAWRHGHPDVNPHTPWQTDAKAAGRSTEGTWAVEFVEALAPISASDGSQRMAARSEARVLVSSASRQEPPGVILG